MTDAELLDRATELMQAHLKRVQSGHPMPFDLKLMQWVKAQPDELTQGDSHSTKVDFARHVVDMYEASEAAIQGLPCARTGCTNGRATHAVEFTVYASRAQDPKRQRGAVGQVLDHVTGVPVGVCDEHAASATVAEWVTDDTWNRICKSFDAQGLATPVRARTRMTPRKLDLQPLH